MYLEFIEFPFMIDVSLESLLLHDGVFLVRGFTRHRDEVDIPVSRFIFLQRRLSFNLLGYGLIMFKNYDDRSSDREFQRIYFIN